MEAEAAGFGRVDEARGIVGAHLEYDAHLKFAQRLAVQPAVDVVQCVHRNNKVDAVARPFGDDIGELRSGIWPRVGVAHREGELVFIPQLLEFVEAVDEAEHRGRLAGFLAAIARL